METRQLRYFLAVAQELHFGRAAKRLHISQPPLSQQIMKFEDELGVRLFSRNKRSVSLTAAGEALLKDANDILQHMDRVKENLKAVAKGEAGRFELGYIGPALDIPLTECIREFKLAYPKIQIGLAEMSTNMQLQAILDGEIDAGVVRLFKHDTTGLCCIKFHQESYALALPVGHRLTEKDVVKITDLNQEEFIFFPRQSQPHLYDEWINVFGRYGFTPNIVQEATTKAASLSLVAAGIGISIVPESTARRAPKQVVFKTLLGDYPSLEIHIIYKDKIKHAGRDNFLSIVQQICQC